MLTIANSNGSRYGHYGRRDFLRIGALGAGSLLSLPRYLQAKAAGSDYVRDKAIVFLFMQGGPSQLETFDPKPDAPAGIRTTTGVTPTSIPGVQFGNAFPALAARADRMTIVRSYVPGNPKHDIKPIVGEATNQASLGALYARLAGTTNSRSGLPTSACLYPRSVDPACGDASSKFGRFNDPGQLGSGYAPFMPGGNGPLETAMRLTMERTRLENRRDLLSQINTLRRAADKSRLIEGMDEFDQQAFDILLQGAADAFDLSKEDSRNVARYDTSSLVTADQIDKKWKNYNRYVDHNRSIGKLLLLARRLVEAGVGFVTITTDFVWDNHADVNNVGVEEGMKYCGFAFDHAVSNFLDDLAERGLEDKVLLVCCGEIGRTPRINTRGGRDHWGSVASVLMAGGGLPRGRVYGRSTPDGGEPDSQAVSQKNLVATLLHTVFDIPRLRVAPN
ncbi:MAG TPA: DUF1501 domain-containing protein, partial [Pirellulales bacterium]|nr:DUF1501 domain-containing protein [Pirellulales bacterium]